VLINFARLASKGRFESRHGQKRTWTNSPIAPRPVFARHPFWQRKFQSQSGRDAILTSIRHWLAGVLARERPALFRQLPESFKVGYPFPMEFGGEPVAARLFLPAKIVERKHLPGIGCFVKRLLISGFTQESLFK